MDREVTDLIPIKTRITCLGLLTTLKVIAINLILQIVVFGVVNPVWMIMIFRSTMIPLEKVAKAAVVPVAAAQVATVMFATVVRAKRYAGKASRTLVFRVTLVLD